MVRISKAQRQATEDRLIEAFVDLMHETGVEGTTVTAVTARAGLARSAFYNYFDDIPALFHAYLSQQIEAFAEDRQAELATIDDPSEQLEVFVAGCLEAFRHQGSPLDVEPAFGLDHQFHVEEQIAPLRELLGEIMVGGVERGAFRSDAASPVVIEMVMHAINSQRLPIATRAVEPAVVAPTVVATLLAAVRATR